MLVMTSTTARVRMANVLFEVLFTFHYWFVIDGDELWFYHPLLSPRSKIDSDRGLRPGGDEISSSESCKSFYIKEENIPYKFLSRHIRI